MSSVPQRFVLGANKSGGSGRDRRSNTYRSPPPATASPSLSTQARASTSPSTRIAATHRPVVTSQIFTDPSWLPTASQAPSAEAATALTLPDIAPHLPADSPLALQTF